MHENRLGFRQKYSLPQARFARLGLAERLGSRARYGLLLWNGLQRHLIPRDAETSEKWSRVSDSFEKNDFCRENRGLKKSLRRACIVATFDGIYI